MISVHSDFPGGNISVERIENEMVYAERELRDTEGDWFYWAFCAEGAEGRTLTFRFPSRIRVGPFGPAVSRDLVEWHWSGSGSGDTFTYTFAPDEDRVYFAHDMLCLPSGFDAFRRSLGLEEETFAVTEKGSAVPCVRFGNGDRWILLTARHHACESTGGYVLEGVLSALRRSLPEGYSVLAVPFVDIDGVISGDQGKNRRPYDHNRDYVSAPIYAVVRELMAFADSHDVRFFCDFHSPWHIGEQNDHVFLSRSTEEMDPIVDRFAGFLKRETAEDELKYTGAWDVGPNEAWNDENTPCSKNWFSRRPSVVLSTTMETPYFGLEDGRISIPAMRTLGESFARALTGFLKTV